MENTSMSNEDFRALLLELDKVLPKKLNGADMAVLIYSVFFTGYELNSSQVFGIIEHMVQIHLYEIAKGTKK